MEHSWSSTFCAESSFATQSALQITFSPIVSAAAPRSTAPAFRALHVALEASTTGHAWAANPYHVRLILSGMQTSTLASQSAQVSLTWPLLLCTRRGFPQILLSGDQSL